MSAPHPHIPFARLTDYAEGRLPPEALPAVRAHLAACAACAAEVAAIARLIGTMRADDAQDAPAHVVARAARLFRQRAQPPAPGLRARLLGTLRFDSGQRPAVFGVRSKVAPARQLLFSAGDYDLDLHLSPAGGRWILAGQVLGPRASGDVEVTGEGGTVHAPLSELGEFTLPPLPPGDYGLVLHLAEIDLAFPALAVGW